MISDDCEIKTSGFVKMRTMKINFDLTNDTAPQVNLISTRKNGQLGLKAKALVAVYVLLAIAPRGFLVAALLFVTFTLRDLEQENMIGESWKQGIEVVANQDSVYRVGNQFFVINF